MTKTLIVSRMRDFEEKIVNFKNKPLNELIFHFRYTKDEINDADFVKIAKALSLPTVIKEITFHCEEEEEVRFRLPSEKIKHITGESFDPLLTALAKVNDLQLLKFSFSSNISLSKAAITKLIENLPAISELELALDAVVNFDNMLDIAALIKRPDLCGKKLSINLAENTFSDTDIASLIAALKVSTLNHLSLNLSEAKISSAGREMLLNAIGENQIAPCLDLAVSKIFDKAETIAFANAMCANTKIDSLGLDNCDEQTRDKVVHSGIRNYWLAKKPDCELEIEAMSACYGFYGKYLPETGKLQPYSPLLFQQKAAQLNNNLSEKEMTRHKRRVANVQESLQSFTSRKPVMPFEDICDHRVVNQISISKR